MAGQLPRIPCHGNSASGGGEPPVRIADYGHVPTSELKIHGFLQRTTIALRRIVMVCELACFRWLLH
jgi:hypothetical protein